MESDDTVGMVKALAAIPAMNDAILTGRCIYADALRPSAEATLHDFGIVADIMAQRLQKGDVRLVRVLVTYEKEGVGDGE